MTPITNWGRFIGCWCAIFGVLVIGLPIPVIVKSFNKFYTVVKKKNTSVLVKAKDKQATLSTMTKRSLTEAIPLSPDPVSRQAKDTKMYSLSEPEENEPKQRSWGTKRPHRRQKISHSS